MVEVKIKREIAEKGCGFVDIEGIQDIFPRDKEGNLDMDKVFKLKETPFVNAKIASGELILLKRTEDKASSDETSSDGKDKKQC